MFEGNEPSGKQGTVIASLESNTEYESSPFFTLYTEKTSESYVNESFVYTLHVTDIDLFSTQ